MPDRGIEFELAGAHRSRFSVLDNQFRPLLGENDQAISLRTLLALKATAGPWSAVFELEDARAYAAPADGALSTSLVNAAELLQAHVAYGADDVLVEGSTLALRLGRWTQDLGGRRLVGRNRYRNTIQAYTGLSADWQSTGGHRLFAFAALPVRIRPLNVERARLLDNAIEFDQEDPDLRFWGVHYTHRLAALAADAEFYLFGLREDDDPRGLPTRNRRLYTPGLRLFRPRAPGDWDLDLETTLQFGTRRATPLPADTEDLDVFAFFQHASVGYTVDAPLLPRWSAELDYASGDARDGDGDFGRFDSLFGPRRTELGPTGLYGLLARENLISVGLRLSLRPDSRTSGYLSWRANWLDEPRDFFARSGVIDPSGRSGRFAGHQFELRARYWLIPDQVQWEGGVVAFLQGGFMEDAPPATGNGDRRFVYTQLSFHFR